MMKKQQLLLASLSLLCSAGVVIAQEHQPSGTDYLELDLARQIALVEQTKKLTALIEELATFPDEAVEVLLASDKYNNADTTIIKKALDAFQNAQIQESVEWDQSSESTPGITRSRVPKLTADNIGFVEVSRPGVPGRVRFNYEGREHGGAVGDTFSIQKKQYTIVSIQYESATQINVAIRTKSGTTNLKYKP